jgi:glycosyltransferase involved in cell wall biosynthesis
MTKPRISIVTPSHNHGEFIEETIRSVVNQRYANLEYIFIDGNSTDNTADIVEKYESSIHRFVSEPDRGQTDALIKGFRLATGDILGWLCSDDLLEPRTLQEVSEFFEDNPDVDFVFGDAVFVDRGGRFVRAYKGVDLNTYNTFPQPSVFWKKSLYDAVGGLDPWFDVAMDADLFIRMANLSKPVHVRKYWSRMRIYPEQKNQALRPRGKIEQDTICEREGTATSGLKAESLRIVARSVRVTAKLVTKCYFNV